jgi:hypothetical protein
LQIFGERVCEFLPGEEFEAPGEAGEVDRGENRIPDFDEILAACVAEDAEGCVSGEGSQDVADELVAVDGVGSCKSRSSGETIHLEDGFKVSVAFDKAWTRSLEVRFGEFGFNKETA